MEYKVLMGFSIDEIDKKVNERTKQGWEPQGGIAVVKVDNLEYRFLQAVVRPDKSDRLAMAFPLAQEAVT